MRAKSLKSSQILRAHMPYFRRPGHKYCAVLHIESIRLESLPVLAISYTLIVINISEKHIIGPLVLLMEVDKLKKNYQSSNFYTFFNDDFCSLDFLKQLMSFMPSVKSNK